MTTWLVTGGAGFIGANLVHHLRRARPELALVVYDALTYAGHRCSLEGALEDGRVRFVHGDVCDAEKLAATFAEHEPRVVLHLAAESHVDRSLHHPEAFLRTNVEGTFRVLEAARARPGTRVVVVSTDEVYGSLAPGARASEDAPLAPSSPYAASKTSADLLALAYHRTWGLDVRVTRCSNNYGPYQLPEKLLPLMLLEAKAGRALPVYGDGLQEREWLHVEDHCRGLVLAAERGAAGRVYNLGGGEGRTNLSLLRSLLGLLERPESLLRFVADRPGHDRRYALEDSRARRELGYAPTITLEEGLRSTVRWYLEHGAWCDAVRTPSHEAHLRRNYTERREAAR